MNEKKWRLGRGPASFGASFIFDFFSRGEGKGKDGGVRHEQEKEQQEESKCVGGKGRRGEGGREGESEVNGGKYREQRERNDGLNPD